ncbi:calbindin-32-like, partial [Stegodyphus dumicola]|uniref:calbindin-32-like n=1 Tax=Stegodyphus dumicola TaxID=202533 RepID=UPI0015B2894B
MVSRENNDIYADDLMDTEEPQPGNGFIEGRELDKFLREFVSSVNFTDVEPEQVVSDSMMAELKECFMEAYDDNKDGKIEIRELAQLLPLEESFLLLFRFDNPLDSSVEFMKIWREYDTDGSGFIEADELKVRKFSLLLDLATCFANTSSFEREKEENYVCIVFYSKECSRGINYCVSC